MMRMLLWMDQRCEVYKPDDLVLSCGCFMVCVEEGEQKEIRFSQCKPDCEHFQFLLDGAAMLGMTVEPGEVTRVLP